MNYEIINLNEKIIVGVSANTSHDDPKMLKIISGLWHELYSNGINGKIENKINNYAIGLYSDYTNNSFTVTAGNEVSKNTNPEFTQKIIPAGKYAKFSVSGKYAVCGDGDMQKALVDAWSQISKMDLNRSFTGDFEEYINCDCKNAEINIYIALK